MLLCSIAPSDVDWELVPVHHLTTGTHNLEGRQDVDRQNCTSVAKVLHCGVPNRCQLTRIRLRKPEEQRDAASSGFLPCTACPRRSSANQHSPPGLLSLSLFLNTYYPSIISRGQRLVPDAE